MGLLKKKKTGGQHRELEQYLQAQEQEIESQQLSDEQL